MDDLQLNITVAKKGNKKTGATQKDASEYKFMSKPAFVGKTIARKRTIPDKKTEGEHQINVPRKSEPQPEKSIDLSSNLRDLSENKGKFHGKNYQDLSDDIQLKQMPRAGGWISSLFKNNPDVPRIGQRAVRPLVEKVFAGKSFSHLDIHPHSVANLEKNLGLKELMVIQQCAVPVILQGRDALIRSQTGSGKTLAYALPIVEGLQAIRPKINRHDGIRVVVVIPTRELAVQTHELFVKLLKPFTWIVPGLLSGGQKRKAEKARLRKGLNILIGTPGRINDHLRHTQSLNFAKTGCLVLDEADCLLEMGYEKDVAAIVKAIDDHKKAATYDPLATFKNQMKTTFPEGEDAPQEQTIAEEEEKTEVKHHLTEVFLSKERQTTLLSATLSKAVANLAGITMVDPVFVDASDGKGQVTDSLKATKENTQKPGPSNEEVAQKETENTNQVKSKDVEENTDQNQEEQEEEEPEQNKGLKQFSQNEKKSLFSVNRESDSISNPVPFPDVAVKTEEKQPKVNLTPIPGVVDMESDDEYVMPTEPHIAPSYEAAVQTAVKEDEHVMPVSVKQTFLIVPLKLRLVTLCSLIVEHCVMNKRGGKLIVFMATLEMVDYHAELIETVLTGKPAKEKQKDNDQKSKKRKASEDQGSSDNDSEFEVDYQAPPEGGLVPVEMNVFSLHGSMPHEQRIQVFDQFRKAKKGVLFCTDVAARGLDVPSVDLVLQYSAPGSATDYVHRVGRTGRASNIGEAVMFLLPSETEYVRYLEQKRIRLTQRNEKTSLEPLLSIVPGAANANRAAIAVQTRLEQTAHTDKTWLNRASRAYTTWVRFYSGYPLDVREFLNAKQIHLGHAAKAFGLRDTPAALAKRAKYDPDLMKERPVNKLTIHDEAEKKRPGLPKIRIGYGKMVNKQSSMHTASEYDSGLSSLDQARKKNRKNK